MQSLLIGLSLFLLSCNGLANTAQPGIDGLWEARYEKSDTPSAHIRLKTEVNGEVVGYVEQAYPRPNEHPSPNCIKCEGANKDKPIIGMKILWGMMPDGANVWDGGTVLDVETSKEYTGKLTLTDNGNKLDMRGYVGLPMFGATDTWTRIKE